MEETKTAGEKLYDIRKNMWAIYNREKSINGVTELINTFSEALAYQLAINEGHIKTLKEISDKLDSMSTSLPTVKKDIQEPNDRKGKTG